MTNAQNYSQLKNWGMLENVNKLEREFLENSDKYITVLYIR